MSLDATPAPEQPQEPSTPPTPAPPLPPVEYSKPAGHILQILGAQQWAWVAPESIRPLPGFGAWLAPMLGEVAAIDCMVVTFDKNPALSKDGKIHLEVPGTPPRYLTFTVEKREGEAAPAARQKDEFSCLLLRKTSLTAHPVFVKLSGVSPEERMKGQVI